MPFFQAVGLFAICLGQIPSILGLFSSCGESMLLLMVLLLMAAAAPAARTGHGDGRVLTAENSAGLAQPKCEAQFSLLQAEHAELKARHAALEAAHESLVAQHTALMVSSTQIATATEAEGACLIEDFLPLEEHIWFFHLNETMGTSYDDQLSTRLSLMDKHGLTRMVITWHDDLPALNVTDIAEAVGQMKKRNTQMAELANGPTSGGTSRGRFRGLCTVYVSLCTVDEAACALAIEQVQTCKAEGLVGIMLWGQQKILYPDGSVGYDFYYKAQTHPLWKEIARLGMFVYLHPADLPFAATGLHDTSAHTLDGITTNVGAYDADGLQCGGFDTGSAYGYAVNVANLVGNLILQGLFAEVPDLQMVVGHNGEFLPYWLWRIDHRMLSTGGACVDVMSPHNFTYYFTHNFHVTTSGFFDDEGLLHLMRVMPPDRILYSTDTDSESMGNGTNWLRDFAVAHPEVSCEALQQIAYKNAEKLAGWPS